MSNTGGIRKVGLTLKDVADGMTAFTTEHFPGVLYVEYEGVACRKGYGHVGLALAGLEEDDDEKYALVWWDQGEITDGFIGGNHPRMGLFGYWLLSRLQYFLAEKLDARPYDDGIGYFARDFGPPPTFAEHVEDHHLTVTAKLAWKAFHHKYERRLVPKPLLPWFDGEKP